MGEADKGLGPVHEAVRHNLGKVALVSVHRSGETAQGDLLSRGCLATPPSMTGGRRLSPHEALRREWGEAYHIVFKPDPF